MDRRDAILALLLISLAVPLQYWLQGGEKEEEGVKSEGKVSKDAWSGRSLLAMARGAIRSVSEWLEWMDDLASDLERGVTDEDPNEDGVRYIC